MQRSSAPAGRRRGTRGTLPTFLLCAFSMAGLMVATTMLPAPWNASARRPAAVPDRAPFDPEVPSEPVKIRNVYNQGAIVPWGGGTHAGNVVNMIKSWPSGQVWQIEIADTYAGELTYKVENVTATGMCLQPREPLPPDTDWYDTEIQPCTSPVSESQQWIIRPALHDRNAYQIIPADHPRRGLTPLQPSTDHTGVKLRTLSNTRPFSWRLEIQ